MLCKNCGAELSGDSAFCTQCGNSVTPGSDTPVVELEKKPENLSEEPLEVVDELLPNDTEKSGKNFGFTLKKETVAGAAEDEGNIFPEPEESSAEQPIEDEQKEADEVQPKIHEKIEKNADNEPITVGAARITGATFISIFAIIALLTVNLLLGVKLGATGDMLSRSIKKMDAQTVIAADIDGESFSDRLYDASNFGEASHNNVDKKDFRHFIEESNFLGFAAENVKKYADFILDGKGSDPSVSANDIVDFYAENGELSKDIFKYEMTAADYNIMRRSDGLAKMANALSIDEWSLNRYFCAKNLNYAFSYITIGIFAALFLVMIIWIAVVVDKQGRHLLGFYGNILYWSGIFALIIGIAASPVMSAAYIATGELAFHVGASMLQPFASFLICFGAGELIIGVILKNIKRAVKNKQKRNAAVEEAVADVVKERIKSFC